MLRSCISNDFELRKKNILNKFTDEKSVERYKKIIESSCIYIILYYLRKIHRRRGGGTSIIYIIIIGYLIKRL